MIKFVSDRSVVFSKYSGFGPEFVKWVETLYENAESCIINNGHCSKFVSVNRGVRKVNPLAPYLFILALELMSATIKKNDSSINVMEIKNSE